MMGGQVCNIREKSYEYGWLDKVTRILENGKEVARFEYHNNNQLAKVVRENGVETFEWDGLALIERNGTKYINEPHAGGSNPILAIGGDGQKTEAIFTDILGTSIGKVSGNGYSAIDKTSFGADTSDKSSFFTGKPYVEGLGYAFLFRNYRSDMGKWLSQDLIGFPDGWNNFAYCRNSIINNYDIYGAVIGVYCAPDAVSGAGHLAMIVGNASTGYSYYSFGSGSDGASSGGGSGSGSGSSSTTETGAPFSTYQECESALKNTRNAQDGNEARDPYTESMKVETTPEQDMLARNYAEEHKDDGYWLIGYNCQDYIEGAVDIA